MTSVAQSADLQALESELLDSIAGAGDLATIEQARIAVLGKKGRIAELMQTLGTLPPEQRKGFGHYEVYVEPAFSQVMAETLAWFRKYLPPR